MDGALAGYNCDLSFFFFIGKFFYLLNLKPPTFPFCLPLQPDLNVIYIYILIR